jgi:hypothetical protein
MALIDCTECGHKVSDQANACPSCGHMTMTHADDKDRLFIANCSLFLFIAGLLVPFIIAVLVLLLEGPKETYLLALGFGFIAELLALFLGNAGGQHFSGKVGKNGAMSIVALLLVLFFAALISWFGDVPPSPSVRPEQPEDQPSGDERIP